MLAMPPRACLIRITTPCNLARTQSESSIFILLSNYVNGHIRVCTFFFHVLAACSTVLRFQGFNPSIHPADECIATKILQDEFTISSHNWTQSTARPSHKMKQRQLPARFLAHVATSIAKDPQSTHARTALLLNVLSTLRQDTLPQNISIPLPPALTQRRVKLSSQHIFMQSPLSNQHPFPLSQHRHSSQPHLQERPPSSPSSVVRAQTRFTLTNSRTSMTFIHLLSHRSCKRLPRTSLFPSLKKTTPHSILTAST